MSKLSALFVAIFVFVSLFTYSVNPAHAARRHHKKPVHKARHIKKPAIASPEKAIYKKATDKLAKLSKDKKRRKYRVLWEGCIRDFDDIAVKYPLSPYAGYALFSKAEACSGMYKVSRARQDMDSAIEAYEYFASQFPDNEYADEALQKAAGMRTETGDKEAAAKDYALIVNNYPNSQYAEQAKKRLKTLPRHAQPIVDKPASPQGVVKDSDSMIEVKDEDKLPRVTGIRHWSNEGSSRVVVDLDGEVKYKVVNGKSRDRLTFEVKKAVVSSPLQDGPIAINDGILKSVRANQLGKDTVRVVLELESLVDHHALMLKDPPRLVIDVTGKKPRRSKLDGRLITVFRKDKDVVPIPPFVPRAEKQPAPVPVQSPEAAPAWQSPPVPVQTPAPAPVVQQVAPKSVKPAEAPSVQQPVAAAVKSTVPKPAAPEARTPSPLVPQPGFCVGVIVIDPGHGGKDSGAVGKGGLMEKDVVLDVGLKLRDILTKELNCKVVMTRDKDVFIDLDARPGIAVQNDADLFISIHANSSPNRTATGIETFLLNLTKDRNIMEVAARENMTTIKDMGDLDIILKDLILDSKRDESLKLAHSVQECLVGDLKKHNKAMNDKGVKQGPFLVLYGASMPSILTEVGFISNKDEEALLGDSDYRENIAQAVYDGIKAYISTTKVASAGQAR